MPHLRFNAFEYKLLLNCTRFIHLFKQLQTYLKKWLEFSKTVDPHKLPKEETELDAVECPVCFRRAGTFSSMQGKTSLLV